MKINHIALPHFQIFPFLKSWLQHIIKILSHIRNLLFMALNTHRCLHTKCQKCLSRNLKWLQTSLFTSFDRFCWLFTFIWRMCFTFLFSAQRPFKLYLFSSLSFSSYELHNRSDPPSEPSVSSLPGWDIDYLTVSCFHIQLSAALYHWRSAAGSLYRQYTAYCRHPRSTLAKTIMSDSTFILMRAWRRCFYYCSSILENALQREE